MREWQSQAHVKPYCRYHIVFVPKYRKQSIYVILRKEMEESSESHVVRVVWSCRGLCDAGSHPHAVDDTAEVQCGAYGRISEGEVGDPDFPGVPAGEAEFHGSAFLGRGLLRQYGRIRGTGDPGVHSEPGAGRETPRADATGRALTLAPSGGFHHTTRSAGGG